MRCGIKFSAIALIFISIGFNPVFASEQVFSLQIPAINASDALDTLAEETGHSLFYPTDDLTSVTTNALDGSYTLLEALYVLLKGTHLNAVVTEKGVIVISIAANTQQNNSTEGGDMKRSQKKISILAGIGALLSMFTPMTVTGQVTEYVAEAVLEEVIVTAQKRSESLQDVPIAISVVNGDQLKELGLQNSGDLASIMPNLEWLDDGSNIPQIFIRGVGDISFHLNQQGGIGLYMDEVSLNSPVLGGFPLYDLERVEVLRGPQNTLFGRNTTGGAIQFISRKPSVETGTNGYVNLNYDSLETFNAEGAVGFVLAENLAMRLAMVGTLQGDWMENVTLNQDVAGYDEFAGRAQIFWQAAETVDVLFNIHGGQKRGDRSPDLTYGSRDPANPGVIDPNCTFNIGNGCADSTGFVFPDGFDTIATNIIGQDDINAAGGSVSIEWRLPTVTVTSVTSFDHADSKNHNDADGGPNTIFYFSQESDTNQWSQEIRLLSTQENRLRWLGGVHYFFEEADWATALRFAPPPAFFALGPRNQGPQLVPNTVVAQDNEVWSVYGQAEFDLTDSLTFSAGLRYTNESKDMEVDGSVGIWTAALFPAADLIGFDEIAIVTAGVTPVSANPDETWEEVGGKVSLDYQHSDDKLFYASVSRGFKGGGTSLAAVESLVGQPGRIVDPESLWSYELGTKTSWLNNSMQINVAFFYNKWEDQQLFTTTTIQGVPSTFLINIPESRSYGAELEMKWNPGYGWYVSGGLAFLDAEVEEAGPEFPSITEGNVLPNSPDITFNGLVRKEWQLANGVVALQTTFNYKDDVQYDISENPVLREDDYWIVNVRGSYRFGPAQEYELAFFGKNLTDTEYCRYRTDSTAATQFGGIARCAGNPGEPIFGASASINF